MDIPVGYGQVNFIYQGTPIPQGAQWTIGIDVLSWAGTLAGMATAIATNYDESDLESVIGSGADLKAILIKMGPNATGPSLLFSHNRASDGGTPCDSPATSTLIHKVTSFGGRSGRGRIYLPNPPDAGVGTGGVLEATFKGQVQTRIDTFADKMTADGLVPVVLHGAGAPLSEPSTIQDFVVDGQCATQRRRNRR